MDDRPSPTLEDIVGLEDTKLGFYGQVQEKMAQLGAANHALEKKQSENQAIIDGISDVMAVVSRDFRIQSVNHVFHRVFKLDNPRGALCHEVFQGRSTPCARCPMISAGETGRVTRELMVYELHGKRRQFEITASPLRDGDGNSSGFLILKRDVTLEREYQSKYYYSEKMATIGLLGAGVAHEINNPLTAISGFTEGLKRRLPGLEEHLVRSEAGDEMLEDFREYLDTIHEECNRCRDIVRSFLSFSPRKNAASAPVDFNGLLDDVIKLLHHQLKHRLPDTIRMDLDPDAPHVRGKVADLKQVVLNLVVNALAAIDEDGQIVVRTRKMDDGMCCFSVIDNGCGISPEDQESLFEPFFTTKPQGKGIGIGLSICYNIIRQHGGDITVKSREGRGTRFKIMLPMA